MAHQRRQPHGDLRHDGAYQPDVAVQAIGRVIYYAAAYARAHDWNFEDIVHESVGARQGLEYLEQHRAEGADKTTPTSRTPTAHQQKAQGAFDDSEGAFTERHPELRMIRSHLPRLDLVVAPGTPMPHSRGPSAPTASSTGKGPEPVPIRTRTSCGRTWPLQSDVGRAPVTQPITVHDATTVLLAPGGSGRLPGTGRGHREDTPSRGVLTTMVVRQQGSKGRYANGPCIIGYGWRGGHKARHQRSPFILARRT